MSEVMVKSEMDKLRKYMGKVFGCDMRTWKNLLNCNVPSSLLLRACRKDIIPREYAKRYFDEIKRIEREIEGKGLSPMYLFLCGDVGNYKTLMGIRYMVLKTISKNVVPLFLNNDELVGLWRGTLQLYRYVSDITFDVTSEIRVTGAYEDAGVVVPFTSICKEYGVILVDDLEESGIEALERLILRAYDFESYLIVTTNISPPDALMEFFPSKVVSRVMESGIIIYVRGEDKRKI